MSIVVILICIFNLVMWFVFLRNFKKLFTTDDIVESTRTEINKILTDLNHNTERNLNLIDNSIARLKALNAEADKKIKLLSELDRQTLALSQFKNDVNSANAKKTDHRGEAYAKNKTASRRSSINPDSSFELTASGEKLAFHEEQKTLFDEKEEKNTSFEQNESYKEIPVLTPKVYASDIVNPAGNKDALRTQIVNLYQQGFDVETVATRLHCSTTEVQFALSIEGLL